MEQTMDRLWRGLGPTGGGPNSDIENWGIPLDVVRDGDDVVVKASLPGVKPDEINVTIEDNVLTVSGQTSSEEEHKEGTYLIRERRTESFHRSIRLPDSIDANKAESAYETGVLTWLPQPRVAFDPGHVPKNDDRPDVAAARRTPPLAAFLVWSRFPFFEVDPQPGGARVSVGDMRFSRPNPVRDAIGRGRFTATVIVPDTEGGEGH